MIMPAERPSSLPSRSTSSTSSDSVLFHSLAGASVVPAILVFGILKGFQMRNITVLCSALPGNHSPHSLPQKHRCQSHGLYRGCSQGGRRSTRPSEILHVFYQKMETNFNRRMDHVEDDELAGSRMILNHKEYVWEFP